MTGDNPMKIKSVSGITCYVKNFNKTAAFYETLGFEIRKREATHITAYCNWFWIDFVAIGKDERTLSPRNADLSNKGAGVFLYLSVDDVDEFHKYLIAKKLKPATTPQDQPWGNREFILRDLDGCNLVIFRRN
jgi:catechol 2,3-dioxygenase-like lactoylglutathione lyase family enzyme